MNLSNHPRCAAVLFGAELHHLDHLAALCDLLEIPLFVLDKQLEQIARVYYPFISVSFLSQKKLHQLCSTVDWIYTCTPRAIINLAIFPSPPSSLRSVLSPHGNSDKGHTIQMMEAAACEERLLVYGQKMLDMFRDKKTHLNNPILIGNIRYHLYIKYKDLFHSILNNQLDPFPFENKTLLYAPTWQDRERSSSFLEMIDWLVEELPPHYNLIIQPHPNLYHQYPGKMEQLSLFAASHPRVVLLRHYCPVYPLLAVADAYLGDMSSMGYDFLAFDKPMFFFGNPQSHGQRPGTLSSSHDLHRCGIKILPNCYASLFSLIDTYWNQTSFSSIRKDLYHYTFASVSYLSLKNQLKDILSCHEN